MSFLLSKVSGVTLSSVRVTGGGCPSNLWHWHHAEPWFPEAPRSNHHTRMLLLHLTLSLLNQLSQHQLTLINPIFMKLDKQTQKFTLQNKLLETRVKHLFWLSSLLGCKGPFQWELESRYSSRSPCMQIAALPSSEAWHMKGLVIEVLQSYWNWSIVNQSQHPFWLVIPGACPYIYVLSFNLETWGRMEPSIWWVRTWRQRGSAYDSFMDPESVKESLQ